jgi:hypothetical protein
MILLLLLLLAAQRQSCRCDPGLQELGHGEPLLELNGVAAHDRSDTCGLFGGLAGLLNESAA